MGEDTFSWIIIILIVILGISIMDSLDDEHEQLNKEEGADYIRLYGVIMQTDGTRFFDQEKANEFLSLLNSIGLEYGGTIEYCDDSDLYKLQKDQ